MKLSIPFIILLIFSNSFGQQVWTQLNSGTTRLLYKVSIIDANIATVVGQAGIILRTTDGGVTWLQQNSTVPHSLQAVYFSNANNGIVVGMGGTILKTTTGGQTWYHPATAPVDILGGLSFVNNNIGTIVGENGYIARTVDGGQNWTQQTSGTTNTIYSVHFTDTNNGTIVTEGGEIIRTTNGGQSWVKQTSGTSNFLRGVNFIDSNNGVVVGQSGTILRTTNGGQNWTQQTSGTTNWLRGIHFLDINNCTVVGENGIVLVTTNGGQNWVQQTSGVLSSLVGVSLWDINSGYAVGFNGTIIKLVDGSGFTVTTGSNPLVGGTSTGSGSYISGTTVSISATANNGFVFNNWTESGIIISTNSVFIFNITSNRNLIANFAPVTPLATNASSILQTSFIANWNASVGASGYRIDVATDNLFTSLVSGLNDVDVGNSTFYSVNNNLTQNNTYYYRVRAYNSGGISTNSNVISVNTLPNPPSAPVAIAATSITQTSFISNWNSSPGATGYYIDVAIDNVFNNILSQYNGLDVSTVNSKLILGLSNYSQYNYRVRAYNSGGVSSNSNVISVNTLPNSPSAPIALAAASITQISFNANWDASVGATTYLLDLATDIGFNNLLINNSNVGNVTTYAISGLTSGTQYWYRVRANNSGGTSINSNTIVIQTLPDAPGATAPTLITTTSFTANWNISLGSTGYKLDVSRSLGFDSFIINNLDVGNVSSYSITGLTAGTDYYYRVRPYNSSGIDGSSIIISLRTISNAPTASSATSITQISFVANWSFSEGATTYFLDVSTDSGFNNLIINNYNVGNVKQYSVTGLNSETQYWYRVRANNSGGTSSNSNTISITTPPNIPILPVANTATQITQSSFTANWNLSVGSAGYLIDVSTTVGFNSLVINNLNVGNVLSYNVTGLSPSTNYYYRIRAYNYEGISLSSMIIHVVTLPNIPLSPLATNASSILQTSFTANWNISDGATGYRIDVATDNLFSNFLSGYNNIDIGNTTSFLVNTNLNPNFTYYYRVRAYNSGGVSSNSNVISVNTLPNPPSAPVALAAASITQISFNANWDASVGATTYLLDLATDIGFNNLLINNSNVGNVTTYAISGLTSGTQYWYRVRANNSGGTSNNSNAISSITLLSAPLALQASLITQTSFVANWRISSGALGYFLDISTNENFTTLLISNVNVGNITSFTIISGIVQNTNYYYRVRAYNSVGTSVNSDIISLVTLPKIPLAPIAIAATSITQTGFIANWNLSIGASGYIIDIALDYQFNNILSRYNNRDIGNINLFQATDLLINIKYYYRIKSYNSGGTSPYSNYIEVSTLPYAPIAPTIKNPTIITQSSFELSWNPVFNIIGYYLDIALDNNFITFLNGFHNKDLGNNNYCLITNLSQNTEFFCRIRSYNSGGISDYSNIVMARTLPLAPFSPIAKNASSILQTSFTANWNISDGATGYRIDVATDNLFSNFLSGYNNIDIGNTTSFLVNTNLNPNFTYYYRVRAYNSGGVSSNSNMITVNTLPNPPSAPVAIAATSITETSFTANWLPVNGANNYMIDISQDINFNIIVVNNFSVGNVASYFAIDLIEGNKYWYRIRAVNQGGVSNNSNIICSITLPKAPTNLKANANQVGTVELSWEDNSTHEMGFIIERKNISDVNYFFLESICENTKTYEDNTVEENICFIYRIKAFIQDTYSNYSNSVSVTSLFSSLLPPTNLSAKSIKVGQIKLTWTDNSNNELGFIIERKRTLSNNYDFMDIVTIDIDNYLDNSISENISYDYRVRAYNQHSKSDYSNIVTIISLATNINDTFMPKQYYLYQNYPNPFNPSTKIKFELPKSSFVTLKVIDLLGKDKANLINNELSSGYYEVEFDGKDLSSGIYLYRLQAGDFIQTKKMILMK